MPEVIDIDHRGYNPNWQDVKSVTQVIAAAGLMGDTSYFTDWHKDRGSYAHKVIELYEADDLDLDTLDPQLRPYLDAWLLFKRDTGWLTAGSEMCYLHPVHAYKGKPDVYGMMNGVLSLIDVKCGQPAKWHSCQCAAYQELLRVHGIMIVSSWCLYLNDKGKYKLSAERASRHDLAVFMNALKGE